MKINKLLMNVLLLFIIIMSISTVYASDISDNITANEDEPISPIESNDMNITESSNNNEEDILSDSPKTITVPFDPQEPNEMLWPKIQPAIDRANPGDTIIIKGSPIHVHATINKTLNIISKGEKTTIDACPQYTHDGLDEYGIFYITEKGSGSTIQGFTFINKDNADTPFSIYINGANDITVINCTMNYIDPSTDKLSGLIIENANNVKLSDLLINNTINGITIINSSNITITDCILSFNEKNAIKIIGDSKNINIISNSIKNNGNVGINLASADNINIINNQIEKNGLNNSDIGSGIYVNTNITKLIVKGNIFLENNLHAILYDYRARNLNNEYGADNLTIVDNNYFEGHTSMVLHHRVYIEYAGGGYEYDAENDVFVINPSGNYVESRSFSYMQNAFVNDIVCGFTYYSPKISWALNGPGNNGRYDFSLAISNITQIKKGVYQVSIIDSEGNIASDFSSFNVTFYLNDFNSENVISKSVKIKNGTATVDFRDLKEYYLESGNIITAEFPGISKNVENNPHVQFNVDDLDIPGVLTGTNLILNISNMVYGSENILPATLSDINNNPLVEKSISLKINGNVINGMTDGNGEVKLPINLAAGNYNASLTFMGDDEYNESSVDVNLVVSKAEPKLTPTTLNTYPISGEYFKVKLTDSNGKAMANQKIAFKINGKSYSANTNKNGIAQIKVSLTAKKTYPVTIKFDGNKNYKSVLKTGKIVVKTGSLKSKITANNMKVKRNAKKTFSFKLTSNNKAISNQKVLVKINGKTYTLKTNSKGIAKLAIKLNQAKKYKINMKFLGNAKYKAVSKTNVITAIK